MYAIYCNSNSPPRFGGGWDLHIANNSGLNGLSASEFGKSYKPPPGYAYQGSKTQLLIAGTTYFTPSEVEVLYLN